MASPFTAKATSVMPCTDIIKQGRSTLVTTVQVGSAACAAPLRCWCLDSCTCGSVQATHTEHRHPCACRMDCHPFACRMDHCMKPSVCSLHSAPCAVRHVTHVRCQWQWLSAQHVPSAHLLTVVFSTLLALSRADVQDPGPAVPVYRLRSVSHVPAGRQDERRAGGLRRLMCPCSASLQHPLPHPCRELRQCACSPIQLSWRTACKRRPPRHCAPYRQR
jgi:hypothetical protein